MFKKDNWFWQAVLFNKRIYYQIFLATFFVNLFGLMSAFYIMTVYDKVVPNSAFSSLIALTIGMVIVHIFDFIIKILRAYFIDVAGQKIDDVVADRLYTKVSSHNSEVLGDSKGKIVSVIREFESFRDFFTSSSMTLFIDVPFMIIFIGILWLIGGLVAIVPTLIAPIVIIIVYLIQPNLKGYADKELDSKQTKLSVLMELLNGHETLRTVSGVNFLKEKWLKSVSDQNKIGVISKVFANFASTFAQTGVAASQTFIIFFGVYLIASTDLTMGALVACVILSGRTLSPLAQLGNILTKINSAMASFRSIDALMNIEAKDERFDEDTVVALKEGSIIIRDLNFTSGDKPLLKDINLDIKHGEKIAILGPVGGGKSTLIKNLVGYYESEFGKIKIDGFDINNIESNELRKSIAYVPQTVQLFAGRVQDNILSGMEDCSNEDIIEAARNANAHEFISEMPGGYSAILSENAVNLSGGQRQKLALARAFLKKPIIAIFDEPTSSLDNETEETIMKYMLENYKETTLIIATHKQNILSLVDRVIIVANGKIVADGPKNQMVKQPQSINQPSDQ